MLATPTVPAAASAPTSASAPAPATAKIASPSAKLPAPVHAGGDSRVTSNGHGAAAAQVPAPAPAAVIMDHLYRHALLGGLFSDTVLCVTGPVARIYPVHAMILAREPVFRDRLLALRSQALSMPFAPAPAVLPPLGIAPTALGVARPAASTPSSSGTATPASDVGGSPVLTATSAALNPLADDMSLASLGFVRGRDYLWRIDVVLPDLATEAAVSHLLTYLYSGHLPPTTLDPASAMSVLATAAAIGMPSVVQHTTQVLQSALTLATLPLYLPLIGTPFAPLVTDFLTDRIVHLPPIGPVDDEPLIAALCPLPWDLLKTLIEDTPIPTLGNGISPASAQHVRFELARRVLARRNRKDESVVVTFGSNAAGLRLIHRQADRRSKKKVWKVGE
ncbi:hypothetical protein GGF32_000128 [Allomyces javanicus]|nr:hypothetical protein GGF32_000128 [Allomyces javanicus]